MPTVRCVAFYAFLLVPLAECQAQSSGQCVGAWYQVATSGPSPRQYPGVAYDRLRSQVVLQGGITNSNVDLSDMWLWDGASWSPSSATGPGRRYAHAMTFDEVRGAVVTFGGSRLNTPNIVELDDTWAWDGNAWTLLGSGAPARQNCAAVFDPNRQQIIAFSGATHASYTFTDTWAFGTGWNQALGFGLPAACCMVGCQDSVRGVVVGHWLAQTWEWDGSFWTQASDLGPAVNYPGFTFNRARGRTVLFGGVTDSGSLRGDTWEYNGATHLWTQVDSAGPTPRLGASMVYDEARQALVLFGGYNYNNPAFNDTWVRSAAPVLTATPAPQRVCPAGSATLALTVIGNGPFLYHWQALTASGWSDLSDGHASIETGTPYFTLAGCTTASMTARRFSGTDHPLAGGAMFRCRVSNACGQITTNPASFVACIADYNCSGSLTVTDIFDYLNGWFAGSTDADINGGGLSVSDIFDFLNAWFAGC